MHKQQLKTGMRVLLRDGRLFRVIQTDEGWNIINEGSGLSSNCYNPDLTCASWITRRNKNADIVKVYKGDAADMFLSSNLGNLLWEREEEIPILTYKGINYSLSTLESILDKFTNS